MDTVLGYIESIMHKRPTVMYTDREAVLKDFQHYRGIQVLQSAPNRHARIAERNIRTIKDMMRAVLVSLSVPIPDGLIKYLVDWVIQRRNQLVNSKSAPNSPAEIYGLRLLTAKEMIATAFGKLGYFKIPTDQQTNDLAPQAEFGIVVGYEASSPSNLKVYVPSRRQVVIRSHGRDALLTDSILTQLTTICNDNSSEDDFVWMDDSEHVESCIQDLGSFNISVKEAYKTLDKAAVDASILSELENMKRYDVWEYVKLRPEFLYA